MGLSLERVDAGYLDVVAAVDGQLLAGSVRCKMVGVRIVASSALAARLCRWGPKGSGITMERSVAALLFAIVLSIGIGSPGISQTAIAPVPEQLSAAVERLTPMLPGNVATREGVRRPLEELSRERCDQEAIVNLAKGLQEAGYRRDAATAHLRFSETCGGHAPSLRSAVNVLLDLSDHAGALAAASDLIKLEPFNNNGYYLRAVAYDRGGSPRKAIDDYVTAIELFVPKERIANVGYFGIARNYEKLGQPCDAALAVESWVALNPALNDTGQTRAMISSYMTKGGCATATAGKEEIFPRARQSNVVTLAATINGIRGTFILDTGATFVALKHSFAQRAKVEVDNDSVVRLNTANGIAEAKRGRVKTIEVRSLKAKDVPVVVQADAKATYGAGLDGLLGMSFLSRFHMTIDSNAVKIRPRPGR
jgi:clan AA aspartic protease (TIGR02281 family)